MPNANLSAEPGSAHEGASFYQSVVNNPGDYIAVLEAFCNEVGKYDDSEFFSKAIRAGGEPARFVAASIDRIARSDSSSSAITSKLLVENDAFFRSVMKESFPDIVKIMVVNYSLVRDVVGTAFSLDKLDLYCEVLVAAGESSELSEFLARGLRSVDKLKWETELASPSLLMQLELKLASMGCAVNLTTPYCDALQAHAVTVLEGGTVNAAAKNRWKDIVSGLADSERNIHLKWLMEKVCDSRTSTTPILELYGDVLIAASVPMELFKGLILQGFQHFCERKEVLELTWFQRLISGQPEIVSSVDSDSLAVFKNRIRDSVTSLSKGDEIIPILLLIAQISGIDENEFVDASPEAPDGPTA